MTAPMVLACGATFAAIMLGLGPLAQRDSPRHSGVRVVGAVVTLVLVLGWLMPSANPEAVLLVLILVMAAIPAATLVRRQRRTRAAALVSDRVLETAELLAAELSAGLSPGLALQHAAQSWPSLEPVAEAERLGADVPAAWRTLAELTSGAADLRLVGAGWDAAVRTGGGLAEATGRVATSIRANRASDRLIASELASARATSRLVAGLPVVALLMGTSEDSHPVEFLVSDPVGLACLAGGLAFGLAGLWWIEAIAAGVHR